MPKRKSNVYLNQTSSSKKTALDPNQPTLSQCYGAAGKKLVIFKRQTESQEEKNYKDHMVYKVNDEQVDLTKFPGCQIMSCLCAYNQVSSKLILSLFFMKEEHIPNETIGESEYSYFKFKLGGKNNIGMIIKRHDSLESVRKGFKRFFKRHKVQCQQNVDFDQCIIVNNKPMECNILTSYKDIFEETISCFESSQWREALRNADHTFINDFAMDKHDLETHASTDNEIEVVSESTPSVMTPKSCVSITGGTGFPFTPIEQNKRKVNKRINHRNPNKALFFKQCNLSHDELIGSLHENEKSFLFHKDVVKSLVKTLADTDVKKTMIDNLCKMNETCHDSLKVISKILTNEKNSKVYEVPEHDATKIIDDHVYVEGHIKMKKQYYVMAISQGDACKIISCLIRRCAPEPWKSCYLVNKDKTLQLNWLLGEISNSEEERFQDGDRRIDMLIAHAFRMAGIKRYSYSEYAAVRRQISQGLSDLKCKTSKISKNDDIPWITTDQIITEIDENDNQDFYSQATIVISQDQDQNDNSLNI